MSLFTHDQRAVVVSVAIHVCHVCIAKLEHIDRGRFHNSKCVRTKTISRSKNEFTLWRVFEFVWHMATALLCQNPLKQNRIVCICIYVSFDRRQWNVIEANHCTLWRFRQIFRNSNSNSFASGRGGHTQEILRIFDCIPWNGGRRVIIKINCVSRGDTEIVRWFSRIELHQRRRRRCRFDLANLECDVWCHLMQ